MTFAINWALRTNGDLSVTAMTIRGMKGSGETTDAVLARCVAAELAEAGPRAPFCAHVQFLKTNLLCCPNGQFCHGKFGSFSTRKVSCDRVAQRNRVINH